MFELSNEDRFNIILFLKESPRNVTGLARELDLTTQETSRHLSRLNDVGLTRKDAEGMFNITAFGYLTIRLTKGLGFISEHQDYFSNRDLGSFPQDLLCRLEELGKARYVDDVMVTVHNTQRILREAEEYILNINMPYISSSFPLRREAYERGIVSKFLHTEDLKIPPVMHDDRDEVFNDEIISQYKKSEVYEERFIGKVDLILYMNEKEVGILTFPTIGGRYDFQGFNSRDETTLRYCREIFQHYWDQGKQVIL